MSKFTEKEARLIARAAKIMESRLTYSVDPVVANSPGAIVEFLKAHYATAEREIFTVTLLDTKHAIIKTVDLFFGTIDGASVYPREVVKLALQHNAAAVIFSHNHPSGNPEPSESDKRLTTQLTKALGTVDIRVLDHIIIGGLTHTSFAERGLI